MVEWDNRRTRRCLAGVGLSYSNSPLLVPACSVMKLITPTATARWTASPRRCMATSRSTPYGEQGAVQLLLSTVLFLTAVAPASFGNAHWGCTSAAVAQHSLGCHCTGAAALPGKGRHRYNGNSKDITIDSRCMQYTCVCVEFVLTKHRIRPGAGCKAR